MGCANDAIRLLHDSIKALNQEQNNYATYRSSQRGEAKCCAIKVKCLQAMTGLMRQQRVDPSVFAWSHVQDLHMLKLMMKGCISDKVRAVLVSYRL